MGKLLDSDKALLGTPIRPFERSANPDKVKELKAGEREREDFLHHIYDGENNGHPPSVVYITQAEREFLLTHRRNREKCFLWVIDRESVKMIRETTRNTKRSHDPCVCHSNLTGAGEAYVGGEMFFGEDGTIYVNPYSDRYGNPTQEQWDAAKEYLRRTGYANLIDLDSYGIPEEVK